MSSCPGRNIQGQRVKTRHTCITHTAECLPHLIVKCSVRNGYYGYLCGAGYWKVSKGKMWPPTSVTLHLNGELAHTYSQMTTKRGLHLIKSTMQALWGFREQEKKEAENSPCACTRHCTWHAIAVLSFSPNHSPSCRGVINSMPILQLKV